MSRSALYARAADVVARPFPERAQPPESWHNRLAESLWAHTVTPLRRSGQAGSRDMRNMVEQVDLQARGLKLVSDQTLQERLQVLRAPLRRQGYQPALVAQCFALLQEAAFRTLGKRHFESQLMGGWALLQGRLVEMATGEGKTLTAALPACTAALAGQPVHIITVNDYLVQRDAAELDALYSFLGLGVGTVVQGMEPAVRAHAYSQPVLYCSNKELAFDYLRDRVALGQDQSALHLTLRKLAGDRSREQPLVMRGLHFGIVDEADSVFIDEARTPLILSSSQRNSEASEQCRRALFVATELVAGVDYQIDSRQRLVQLTEAGKDRISDQADDLPGLWQSTRGREVLITQALNALHLFQRDEHYVVAEGKVQIVDESTGRILADRSWERGLHQMVEAKEGCELSDERKTLARITYQRLFRRYLRLAGMTGTASEVAPEIRQVYGLDVVSIPLNRPLQRSYWPTRAFTSKAEKWQAVVDQIKAVAGATGRPVLIGTRSVKASEEISAVLRANGIEHALLNAKQDQFEAELVSMAGQRGRVTVATNMAGRGTDIALGPDIAALGGLHVILTEFHESLRIDRQLFGRCARQGDPGSCSVVVALEDEIFSVHAPYATAVLRRWVAGGRDLPVPAIQFLRRLTQASAERKNARLRIQNLKQDRQLDQILAFSGSQ